MFGKKKNKDDAKKSDKKQNTKSGEKAVDKTGENKEKQSKQKRKFPIKKIIILLLLSIALSGGFYAYKRYFAARLNKNTKKYVSMKMKYITLPDEILRFTFNYFPNLYISFVNFNNEIILIDGEISRIKDIGTKYPPGKKIADKEEKTWRKTRDKIIKTFEKIENKTELIYVLFQVNKQRGMEKIKEEKSGLESSAKEALVPVLKLTERLKNKSSVKAIPKGFIKGIIYKLKQKIGF